MAVGKNKRLTKGGKKGQKKKIVDPFTRKEWYDVRAPVMFNTRGICKTPVNKTAGNDCSSLSQYHVSHLRHLTLLDLQPRSWLRSIHVLSFLFRYPYRVGQLEGSRVRSVSRRPAKRRGGLPQVPPHLRGCSGTQLPHQLPRHEPHHGQNSFHGQEVAVHDRGPRRW